MASQRLEIIQCLRGIAATMVVLLHFKDYLASAAPSIREFMEHGYLGVDVFFVISGFIIHFSTQNLSTRQPRSFLLRRLCRVVLPAWLVLILMTFAKPPYLRDLLSSIFFIPLANVDPPFYGYSVLIVAWTLSYELVFYAMFAAVMMFDLGRRWRGLMTTLALFSLVFLMQTVHGGCCTLDAGAAPLAKGEAFPATLLSLLGNPMLLEFSLGIGLSSAYLNGWFRRPAWQLYCVLLSALPILYCVIQFQYRAGHGPTHGGLLAILIVFFALCLQALKDEAPTTNHITVSLIALGEMSYSLYLIHPVIKSVMARPAITILLDRLASPYGKFLIGILFSGLSAHLLYRCVELPAQRLGRSLAASLSSTTKCNTPARQA